MGRRNSDDSPTLKKVLSTGRDIHELRYGGESSHYLVVVDKLVHVDKLHVVSST